jgi:hypothetical protein
MAGVPATYLLLLERQLVDLRTFIDKLPVLDAAESWEFDPVQDCYATGAVETTKTRKVPRNHVKAEATKEHPAQVEVYYEDVTIGRWRTVKYSGALPASRVHELRDRVEHLQEAVKFAREEANAYRTLSAVTSLVDVAFPASTRQQSTAPVAVRGLRQCASQR